MGSEGEPGKWVLASFGLGYRRNLPLVLYYYGIRSFSSFLLQGRRELKREKKFQFQMCVWVVARLPQKVKTKINVF